MPAKVFVTNLENQGLEEGVRNCFEEIIVGKELVEIKKVLIKPNLVNGGPSHTGVTVDLRILEVLIHILKENSIDNIYIGEASLADTEKVFEALGVYKFERSGVEVVNFEKDKWEIVRSPLGLSLKDFLVPRTLLDCDLILNIAKMKTHDVTGVSLSLKNLFGCLSRGGRKIAHKTDVDNAIVDIFSFLSKNKEIISFVDGLVALEGKRGPTIGKPVKLNCVLASSDSVALDATCVEIMGSDPKKIRHLSLANEFGLGEMGEKVVIEGQIKNIKKKFEMPILLNSPYPFPQRVLDKVFKKKPFVEDPSKCIKCGDCVRICPLNCILLRNSIKIDYERCIGCLCCCEACASGALNHKIKNHFLYKFLGDVRDRIRRCTSFGN